MPQLTLKYWADPVTRDDDLRLCGVIALGAKYYRRLAELENDHRKSVATFELRDPQIADLCAALTRPDTPAPERDAVADRLRARRLELKRDPAYALAYKVHAEAARTIAFGAKRDARGLSGLAPGAWGTYQAVEEAHDRARQDRAWPEPIRAYSPADEGVVAVHVQGRVLTRDDLHGARWAFAQLDADLYGLGRRTPAGHDDTGHYIRGYAARSTGPGDHGRSGRPGAQRLQEFRIRVGSDGRAPIWARLHVLVCRPIPDGDISWVRVHRVRVGIRYRWYVQIVIDAAARVAPAPQADLIAVDLRCGRRVEGGRLLAYAIGSDGVHHPLVMPELQVVERGGRRVSRGVVSMDRDKVDDLASIRSKRFNDLVAALRIYAETLAADHWLRAELAHAHAWRSWGRIVSLYRLWCTQRYTDDVAMHRLVEAEIKQDRHLYMWQACQRDKIERRVRGRVEQWAAMLTNRYAALAVEDIDLRRLIDADKASDRRTAHIVAQRVQALAPGRVREALVRAAHARQRAVHIVETPGTTSDGATPDVPPWENAARNILARASAQAVAGQGVARRTKAKSRHTRRRAV